VHEPLQHVVPSTHDAPAGPHASHVPDALHERLQHSSGEAHAAPAARQASQVPAGVQWVVQQSASAVHAAPSGMQHPTPNGFAPRHSNPGQQAFSPTGGPRTVRMHVVPGTEQHVPSPWHWSVPEHVKGGSQRVLMHVPPDSGGLGIRIECGLQQPTTCVNGPPSEQQRHEVANPGGRQENPFVPHVPSAAPSHSSSGGSIAPLPQKPPVPARLSSEQSASADAVASRAWKRFG
jgi:hypothetical protein